MSHFSQSLTHHLSIHSWTGAHLASLCHTHASTISRYISGESAPKPEAISELLCHFAPEEQSELAKAYLLDQIPAQFTTLIRVATKSPGEPQKSHECHMRPDCISDELWAQICRIAEYARDSPEAAAIIENLARFGDIVRPTSNLRVNPMPPHD